ncbi:Glycosyl transferase family 11 [Loktanella sp. DSM 29012]|nr:Glycosyl transferase family 11 [Loktanella sp. DSM 29012]
MAQTGGQLGNQLFQAAHLVALGAETGLRVLNPAFHAYADAFVGSRPGAVPTYPTSVQRPGTTKIRKKTHDILLTGAKIIRRMPSNALAQSITCEGFTPAYDIDLSEPARLAKLMNTPVTALFGWRFRNTTLTKKHDTTIRSYFRFENTAASDHVIRQARLEADIIIGLHVRHGDYAVFQNGRYFLTLEEYLIAARHVAEQCVPRRVSIMVFSDSPQDLPSSPNMNIIRGPGSVIGDLQAMSQCDYIIAVPSTFSRWAAFVGRVPLGLIARDQVKLSISQFRNIQC